MCYFRYSCYFSSVLSRYFGVLDSFAIECISGYISPCLHVAENGDQTRSSSKALTKVEKIEITEGLAF